MRVESFCGVYQVEEHFLKTEELLSVRLLTCIVKDNLNTSDCHQICALCVESAAEEKSGQHVPGLSRQA